MDKNTKIKIKSCQNIGYACPAQWICQTNENKYLYIRYRDGWFSIEEMDEDGELYGPDIMFEKIGDDYDGYMDTNKMLQESRELLDFSDCTYLPIQDHVFIGFTTIESPAIQEQSEYSFVKSVIEHEKRDILIEIISRIHKRLNELREIKILEDSIGRGR